MIKTKQELLNHFTDINAMYNNPFMYQTLSNMIDELLEQQPCEDCISREKAFNALFATDLKGWQLAVAFEAIDKLPAVTPQHKTGEWVNMGNHEVNRNIYIFKCSNCHKKMMIPLSERLMYCPNCGSYNGGGEDNES